MVIKVYLSMISCSQEVKKNQQRAVMILESKNIPFVTLDITDPGQEESKDYMNETAKPKGNNKVPMTPQIYNEADYCGDFEDLDMANETDTLGEFLKLTEEEKKGIKIGITGILPEDRARSQTTNKEGLTNGVSPGREMENHVGMMEEVTEDVREVNDTGAEEPTEAEKTTEALEDTETSNTTDQDAVNTTTTTTEETREQKEETAEKEKAEEEKEETPEEAEEAGEEESTPEARVEEEDEAEA